jgi:hypothetical protein
VAHWAYQPAGPQPKGDYTMRIILLVLSLTLLLPRGLYADVTVLTGPVVYNHHDYYLLGQSSWTDAEAEATTLGGHLVTINDAAENTFVFTTFDTFGGIERFLWIGFTDEPSYGTTEGTFVWSSGEPVTYTNWNAGEPNNNSHNPEGDENFTFIYPQVEGPPTPGGSWNDVYSTFIPGIPPGLCGGIHPCEINGVVEVVPEPSGVTMVGLGIVGLLCYTLRRKRWLSKIGD